VKNYLAGVFEKLGVKDRTEAVGLCLEEPASSGLSNPRPGKDV